MRLQLLVVPDLDELARCIAAHATTHEKNENDPEKAEAEYCRIEELLAQKVLISISKRSSNNLEGVIPGIL